MAPATNPQKAAAATSRSRGAVGNDPLVYRRFRKLTDEVFPQQDLQFRFILDFGAGRDAKHTAALKADHFPLVEAYDFPENSNTEHHISEIKRKYDVVLASNVLNIQQNEEMFNDTLQQITLACCRGGYLVCNYPHEPRHWEEMTNTRLLKQLEYYFHLVDVSGPREGKGTLVIIARKR
jgi:hypothetical protein